MEFELLLLELSPTVYSLGFKGNYTMTFSEFNLIG